LNQINTVLRRENKNTSHKYGKSKQIKSCKDDEITKRNENILKVCENHLFNKKKKLYERKTRKERKIIMRGDFGSKLPKSPLFG